MASFHLLSALIAVLEAIISNIKPVDFVRSALPFGTSPQRAEVRLNREVLKGDLPYAIGRAKKALSRQSPDCI
ncbi:uncharacterized protein ARMOST_17590 [Armillaria ostoyae]|uniref:Uncharacterized protein n=1 Tax=Armillaria ostoyae TaxID=47428 RepID=A0A284RZE5_ARMOS|nr:uncharacterized protein ARMOST_17590 [Armillaria ostoyae]